MAYDRETEVKTQYGKEYHEMLKILAADQKRNLRQTIEQLIATEYAKLRAKD